MILFTVLSAIVFITVLRVTFLHPRFSFFFIQMEINKR